MYYDLHNQLKHFVNFNEFVDDVIPEEDTTGLDGFSDDENDRSVADIVASESDQSELNED